MAMKSKDLLQQELKDSLAQAFSSENEDAIAQAFAAFADSVQQNVMEEYAAYQKTQDSTILAKRGVHQLTADETKFYQGLIDALSSSNPKQAITDINISFPESVIDNIIADIRGAHPLLAAINFTNTATLTKMLLNKQGAQLAVWGPLSAKITAELQGAIGKIDLTICKLSAFMAISKDMLVAGPEWVDAYVRGILSEATALALETAIVTGTGKDMPIGMDRDVSDDVTVTGGVYPKKEKVAVADFSPKTYGAIISKLATAPNDKTRPVKEVLMIVNPADYFSKVFPATTVRAADGTYSHDVFPYPTVVIQSPAVAANEAVFGLADKYFMGIGAGTSGGKIEYSDEFRFLDDERVYLTKLFGNGRALDDNAFVLADITNLVPASLEVVVTNVVKTKEQA